MQVLLVDRSPSMVRAWQTAFADRDDVEVIEGDYFARAAGAMVSPANSFAIMDGGLDAAIRDTLGFVVSSGRSARSSSGTMASCPLALRSSSRPGMRDGRCW